MYAVLMYHNHIIFIYLQVLLGIILNNENVLGDMIDILLYLYQYVLCRSQNAVDNLTQKEVSHDAIYEIYSVAIN